MGVAAAAPAAAPNAARDEGGAADGATHAASAAPHAEEEAGRRGACVGEQVQEALRREARALGSTDSPDAQMRKMQAKIQEKLDVMARLEREKAGGGRPEKEKQSDQSA